MSKEVSRLIDLLEEMEVMCERMLPMIAAERKALVELEFDRLKELAGEKNELAGQLARKRDEGRELVARLGESLAGEKVETISQLLPHLHSPWRSRLGQCYLRFRAKAQAVEFQNATNRVLAEEGAQASEEMVQALASLFTESATYDRSGQAGPQPDLPAGHVQTEV